MTRTIRPVGSGPQAPTYIYVDRGLGSNLIVVHPLVDVPELPQWEAVRFTTDLEEVTWLH